MTLKKILGCIAAAGLSVGGLILAGKSEFGKGLGAKPVEYDPDDLDLPCEDAAPEETETEPEPEAEE
jgi:hypothetical protein